MPKAEHVYSGAQDNEVHKIDANGDQVWAYTGHSDRVQAVAVDADGNVYSGDDDFEVHKIDANGDQVWAYTGHSHIVRAVAVSFLTSISERARYGIVYDARNVPGSTEIYRG